MKKFTLFTFLFILLSLFNLNIVFAQILPRGLTPEEEKLYYNFIHQTNYADDVTPPPTPVRTIAEWEELQAMMITWTSYPQILAQMVDYAQDECLVYIVCSDSNSVKTSLTGYGVPLVNLRFIIAPLNSIWSRDYGPWTAYTNNIDSLKIIDWKYNRPARPQDDQIPTYIASFLNVPIYQAISSPDDFIATGGNFMTDGHGTAFSSKLILTENPTKTETDIDTIIKKYNGIKRYVLMETLPYDLIHHIDMHMKLLDEETLLVGQYPTGVSDGPQIELNLQYILNNFQTCFGKPYKVVRIPMPPDESGYYPPSSDYLTYTNSTFINNTVMVPIYGLALDTTALRIYREALPGYRVVGINCRSIISLSGAIHCINKEIGVFDPIFISHSAIRNATTDMPSYEVKAYIKTKSGISNAKCFWTTDTTSGFSQLTMTATADTFKANIPSRPLETKIYYYISATSNNSKTITKPLPAPSGNFRFTVTNSTFVSNGNELINDYKLFQNYPNPFNPSTNIKFQIPRNSFVTLKIYDILGKEVATLVNENLQAGTYEIPFSISQFSGNRISSGLYFYKLKAGDFTETKKMLLVK
ncbi:MAG: agmatine deiminase family protein [Ignavibacteria bacterium]|jgi:agmatine/peptidylarginine deiminase